MGNIVTCIKCGRTAEVEPYIASVNDSARAVRRALNVDIWICIEHVEEWK